jgi:hypothetical protein
MSTTLSEKTLELTAGPRLMVDTEIESPSLAPIWKVNRAAVRQQGDPVERGGLADALDLRAQLLFCTPHSAIEKGGPEGPPFS